MTALIRSFGPVYNFVFTRLNDELVGAPLNRQFANPYHFVTNHHIHIGKIILQLAVHNQLARLR